MNEFGHLVKADEMLAVSRERRCAVGIRSVVAYSDGLVVDLVILRGLASDAQFWHDAIHSADGMRLGFSFDPDDPPELGTLIRAGFSGGAMATLDSMGGGGVSGADGGVGQYGVRTSLWPYPATNTLVIGWSWVAEGIQPGTASFVLPLLDPKASVWE